MDDGRIESPPPPSSLLLPSSVLAPSTCHYANFRSRTHACRCYAACRCLSEDIATFYCAPDRLPSLPFPSQLPSSVRPLLPSRLLSCTAPTCAQQSNFSLRGCTLLPMITWCPTGLEPETLLRCIKAHFRAARCDDNILEVLSGVSLSPPSASGSVCGLSKARETHRRNRMVLACIRSKPLLLLLPPSAH